MTENLPCPFCGMEVDLENPDVLYPSGVAWKYDAELDMRTYHNFREVPKEQWCYSIHCPTSSGGCGAEIDGDNREETLRKWNTRAKI